MNFDWSDYYPPDKYPTNPAQCPTKGCSVVAPDPSDKAQMSGAFEAQYASTLSSMGWADCPEHGRWCFMPTPESIDLERQNARLKEILEDDDDDQPNAPDAE